MQTEIKATLGGIAYTKVHDDLFIPPDALEILLESFTGPLDLLLYLIRKQNIDILDIPITSITQQYLHYIQMMENRKLELAADYLLMAAMLAEIKSRLLLPVTTNSDEEEDEDPRMALVRRLQAYEQIKQAAELLDALPRQERDHFQVNINAAEVEKVLVHPDVALADLLAAIQQVLEREDHVTHHQIAREAMSVRDRMVKVLSLLQEQKYLELNQLFTQEEGRAGLVVSLLAILELARQAILIITQAQAFSPIHIKAA